MIVLLEIPGLPETLALCPDHEADWTRRQMKNPGRCWTWSDLAQLRGKSREEALKIAEARMMFEASKVWTEKRETVETEPVQEALFT